ncbi:MAG: SDR family NAD(P)-dependent oxidoreductase [Actinomycetota bacterium]|nr:SDR family NAD(P)-dependent oxidoreductase [Actinomycetota bacterium]MDD5665850.1 SDR family NAD(P)-dependent oxidoreductase [Actinomycetota bacterium]
MYPEFKGFVVMVTGAASGIGLAVARQFIEEEAVVISPDIDEAGLGKAAAELGDKFIPYTCDISKADKVAGLAAFVRDGYGRLDVLVNNAAMGKLTAIDAMTEEDFYYHYEVDVKGAMLMITSMLPLLRESAYPSIVNMSSSAALVEHVNHHFLYSTAKAAVLKYTMHLARDLPGIRANAILPGWVDTPIYERAGFERSFVEQVYEKAVKHIPAGRIAMPDDIANAILFLCSKKASYVNGAALQVDGGYLTGADWGFPF